MCLLLPSRFHIVVALKISRKKKTYGHIGPITSYNPIKMIDMINKFPLILFLCKNKCRFELNYHTQIWNTKLNTVFFWISQYWINKEGRNIRLRWWCKWLLDFCNGAVKKWNKFSFQKRQTHREQYPEIACFSTGEDNVPWPTLFIIFGFNFSCWSRKNISPRSVIIISDFIGDLPHKLFMKCGSRIWFLNIL